MVVTSYLTGNKIIYTKINLLIHSLYKYEIMYLYSVNIILYSL